MCVCVCVSSSSIKVDRLIDLAHNIIWQVWFLMFPAYHLVNLVSLGFCNKMLVLSYVLTNSHTHFPCVLYWKLILTCTLGRSMFVSPGLFSSVDPLKRVSLKSIDLICEHTRPRSVYTRVCFREVNSLGKCLILVLYTILHLVFLSVWTS